MKNKEMEYNTCEICGACEGRAGLLFGNASQQLPNACQNCHDTRKTGKLVIHSHLVRTSQEIEKTINILGNHQDTVKGNLI